MAVNVGGFLTMQIAYVLTIVDSVYFTNINE